MESTWIFFPIRFSLPVELGVFPPNHGETNRASGEAPTYIGDREGWWCLLELERPSLRGVSSHSHLPSSQSDLPKITVWCYHVISKHHFMKVSYKNLNIQVEILYNDKIKTVRLVRIIQTSCKNQICLK